MTDPLRILILEDNPVDAELVQFELREAGLVFTSEVVTTEKGYIQAIHDSCPDLILSDYDLPTYNGALALVEARRRCPDTPFILVTGAVTEERAIDILTQGAKDYVLKTRLQQRLVPAVLRAIAEADEHRARKQAEEEVRAASLYSRTLIEASLDPLVTISPEGKVMDVNKATEAVTGVSRDQLIGTDFSDYFTEPDKARLGYEKAFSDGSITDYPLSIRHISGRITEVLYNATTYLDKEGKVQGVFAAARDVTKLKMAEEAIFEAHKNLENQVAERTADLQKEIEQRYRVEQSLLGYNERIELLSYMASRLLASDKPQQIVEELCLKVMEFLDCDAFFNFLVDEAAGCLHLNACAGIPKETMREIEWLDYGVAVCGCAARDARRIVAENIPATPDARTELVKSFGIKAYACHPLMDQDRVMGTLSFGTRSRTSFNEDDLAMMKAVADQVAVAMTRIRTEDALRESEEKYRLLVKYAPAAIYEIDFIKNRFKTVSDGACRMLGYTEEELLAMAPMDIIDKESQLIFFDRIRKAQAGEILAEDIEYKGKRKDGSEVWGILHNTFKFSKGQIVGSFVVAHDITERRRAEEEVRRQRELLQVTLSSIGDAVIATDAEGRVTFMNAVAESLTGWPLHEASLRPATEIFKVVNEYTRQAVESPVTRVLAEGVIVGLANHTLLVRRDGTEVLIDDSGAPIKDAAGKTLGVVLVFRDMTERKRAEDTLQTTMHRLTTLISSMHGALLLVGEEKIELANQTFCDYFELKESPAELIGLAPAEMLEKIKNVYHHPDEALGRIREIVSQDRPVVGEEVALRQGRTCLRDYVPISVDGKSYGRLWYHIDITERKKAEEALHRGEALLKAVLDNIPEAIYLKDRDSRLLMANPATFAVVGKPAEAVLGKTDAELYDNPATGRAIMENDRRIMASGQMEVVEESVFDPAGTRIYLSTKAPYRDGQGRVIGLIGVAREITERRRAETALMEQTKQLEAANKELDSFSYSVSHDLRAPLRAIEGYSRMILKKQGEPRDEETRQRLQMIMDNTKKMGRLIDDLLALSRFGSQAVTKKDLDMEELVSEVWSELLAMHPDRKMTLRNGPMPVACGDRSLIWQVYSNLLNNAVKFTHGRECGLIETGGFVQNGEMIYYVRDNGVGFDMRFCDKLFGAFQRLHSEEEYKGTGIGLALVKRIIQRHDGRVWAEGEVDKGATFFFTLPAAQE